MRDGRILRCGECGFWEPEKSFLGPATVAEDDDCPDCATGVVKVYDAVTCLDDECDNPDHDWALKKHLVIAEGSTP